MYKKLLIVLLLTVSINAFAVKKEIVVEVCGGLISDKVDPNGRGTTSEVKCGTNTLDVCFSYKIWVDASIMTHSPNDPIEPGTPAWIYVGEN